MILSKEIIAIVWIGGIGIGALLSSFFLASSRTKEWSELKIVSVSLGISIVCVSIILYLIKEAKIGI